MKEINYNVEAALNYANKWALSRNPKYFDFSNLNLGGDCTNFVSQCLYAGSNVMNLTKTFGWYYVSLNNRSPAWSGVQELYNFLVNNKGVGPFGSEKPLDKAKAGDIIQLSFQNAKFSHSLFVTDAYSKNPKDILIAAHTYNALNKPLSEYLYLAARLIHIQGVRSN